MTTKHTKVKTIALSLILMGSVAGLPHLGFAQDLAASEVLTDPSPIVFTLGATQAYVGEAPLPMESPALLQDGRTYLPLRALSQAVGADLHISDDLKAIAISYQGHQINLRTDSTVTIVDGQRQVMATAPYINAQGRTMVPVRVVSENLGIRVEATYNDEGQMENVLLFTDL